MKKNILFLSTLPPPYYGASLLSEKCLRILKNSKKFEVHNIKLNYSKDMDDIGKINLNKICGIFKVKKQITQELDCFKPDIIYFAPATSSLGLIRDAYFTSIIKRKKFSILFHLHSRITEKIRGRKLNKKILEKMLSKEKVIVLGKELVENVSWIIPFKNIFILPNAIQNEVSNQELNRIIKTKKNKKKINILFLSNMIESKGWFKVIESCKILKEKKIKFICNFVGAWPSVENKKKFFKYVVKNKLEKYVNYMGRKTDYEKNKILASSDIFVFPTEYELETFGLVIIEAMMFGIPVIANNIATIPSVVQHKKTGFILYKNTPKEISEYLEKLIKNKTIREEMGKKGRERFLKYFEISNYGKKLIDILKDA